MAFLKGLGKLLANYRTGVSPDQVEALKAAWWETITARPSVTDQVFERAVAWTLKDPRTFMPTVGEFLAICDFVIGEVEREHERAQQDLARPTLQGPPASPQGRWSELTRDQRAAFFERHTAIGKLRFRTGHLLNGGDPNAHEFTDAEIAAVVAEMRSGVAPVGPIARDAGRVVAQAATAAGPEWPGAAPAGAGPIEADWRDIPDDPEVRAKPHIPDWTAEKEAALLAKWPRLAQKTDPRTRPWPTKAQEREIAARKERLAARNGAAR